MRVVAVSEFAAAKVQQAGAEPFDLATALVSSKLACDRVQGALSGAGIARQPKSGLYGKSTQLFVEVKRAWLLPG